MSQLIKFSRVKHQREVSMLAHSVMLLVLPNATDVPSITERHSLPLSSHALHRQRLALRLRFPLTGERYGLTLFH